MKRTYFLYILILFIASVALRVPNINRPLSANYEWVTAHTLVTLEIWDQEGIISHKFNPIYTYPNPNDHYIKCPISGVSDEEGNYYYVSYPPFSFILPHLIFQISNIQPSALSLQVFNLILHFLCSILIFLIATNNRNDDYTLNGALLGTAVYIFAPINLWNHTNVYFADILVQLFFLLSILFYQRLLGRFKRNRLELILFLIAVFLMLYTEWLGVLLAATLFTHSLLVTKQFRISISIILISLTALSLIAFQYSSIAGIEDFLSTLSNRYSERSGNSGPNTILSFASHLYLGNMYLRNFFPFLVVIFFASLVILSNQKEQTLYQSQIVESTIIVLSAVAVLLHHFVLFEFTIVHELSLVKAAVPISLLISLLSRKVFVIAKKPSNKIYKGIYLFIFISMISLGSYFYYTHIITPIEYSSLRLGTQIKETSNPSDTIFFKSNKTQGDFLIKAPDNFVIAPQIQYYSGRCIQVVKDEDEALNHLNKYNKEQGIIFEIENPRYKVESVQRVFNPDY